MGLKALKTFLTEKAEYYNHPAFITHDPIALPHAFEDSRDIEIMGLFAAIMAWGQRKTILNKGWDLIQRMDYQPYQFVKGHDPGDLTVFDDFVHRTLQPEDVKGILRFLQRHYQCHTSLEALFIPQTPDAEEPVETGLRQFHQAFSQDPDLPERTLKHIATPAKKAACKRLNMFLRWMIRRDEKGVDFGIWHHLSPADLFCPLDVHVVRMARHLSLLSRKQTDWQATLELTKALRTLDAEDPVRFDFALFGLGIEGFASAMTSSG